MERVKEKELKITYTEGGTIRVIRAKIIGKDDDFLILQRQNGTIKINKGNVVKIEEEA